MEIRAVPAHKTLWESLVARGLGEDLTDWLNDAANERACRQMENIAPGTWDAKGILIVRPSTRLRRRPAAPSVALPIEKPKRRRRKR